MIGSRTSERTESNLFLYERMVGKANYFMLKYEELVENPATKLSQISSFLGVPFEPETLAEKRTGRHSRQPQHANINKPFLGSRVFAWKEDMDARVEQICRVQAAEALWKFDYELDADRERLGGIPRP